MVFVCGSLFAQNNYDHFKKGNEFYNNGDFQEAIASYESIIESGEHSADLYFNLANAYYKMNQVAPSIFYYEKALQLAPTDQEIKNNLSYAQNMTIDDIEVIPETGFSKISNSVINSFSFDVWAMIAVTLTLLFVILFLSYYFSYATHKKRILFVFGFTSLALGLFALTMAYQKYGMVQNENSAIVFEQESEVKTDPNLRSETAFKLHEGTKVMILESFNDNWVKIRLADGKTGWIVLDDVKMLNKF